MPSKNRGTGVTYPSTWCMISTQYQLTTNQKWILLNKRYNINIPIALNFSVIDRLHHSANFLGFWKISNCRVSSTWICKLRQYSFLLQCWRIPLPRWKLKRKLIRRTFGPKNELGHLYTDLRIEVKHYPPLKCKLPNACSVAGRLHRSLADKRTPINKKHSTKQTTHFEFTSSLAFPQPVSRARSSVEQSLPLALVHLVQPSCS